MLSIHTIDSAIQQTSRVKVKICGIMRPEHALVVAQCGADMVGVVFAESRRKVSMKEAWAIRKAVDDTPIRPMLIGVFVNETPARIRQTVRSVGLDAVQLSGDESLDTVLECLQYSSIIKTLRFPKGALPGEALATLNAYAPYTHRGHLRLLVDAYHPLEYGGTGQTADWSLAACLAKKQGIILAGGLTTDNLEEAITQVSPWGIDVSSGVERDGAKDPRLIAEFIGAARRATPPERPYRTS